MFGTVSISVISLILDIRLPHVIIPSNSLWAVKVMLTIEYIEYRSLTTYRLWSPMLLFVYDNIKVYNVRERRVHLTEASPIDFVQNVNYILLTFRSYHVQPGVSVCFRSTGSDHVTTLCVLYVLSDVKISSLVQIGRIPVLTIYKILATQLF